MTNKIWLDHYPSSVPAEINPDIFSSIDKMFAAACKKFHDKTALSNFGHRMTYQELFIASRQLANYFSQQLHLKKGQKIALMMPNIMQYYVALFAALQSGLIVVNINPMYTAREVSFILKDAEVDAIVVLENFAHTLELALQKTPVKHIVITRLGDTFPAIKASITDFVVKHIKKLVKPYKIPQALFFKKILSAGNEQAFQSPQMQGEDIAFLQYTGGTTGLFKAAMLTHRNIIANTEQMLAWVNGTLKEGEEILIAPLPLYHIFSLTVCAFTFVALGGHIVLITDPRDIAGLIKTLKQIPFTVFVGINTLFDALVNHPMINQVNFKSLRATISGGMSLQKSISEIWRHLTGNYIVEGYGLTEASPVVSINLLDGTNFTESAGMPISSTDVVCLDDQEKVLEIGEIGEICVKGPQVMKTYWKQEEETKHVFSKDGWLKTGDIGYINEKGLLYIVDRKKDMILISGFNVFPKEIEDVIASHQGVAEVAVVGIPDKHSGEAIKAYVVKKDPSVSEEEILAFCKERLTGYKIPKYVEFDDALPKSTVGKVLRYELKKRSEKDA